MTQDPAFPSLYEYALARRCTNCGAQPGLPCEAPRKQDEIAGRNRIRAMVGQPPVEVNPLHTVRVDAGSRHLDRDVAAAPWPKDREPGRPYDTLDKLKRAG
ncbi:hypothetical protein ABIE67_009467 [Streptomyces sp. V4I8]|uniref:zinc finger domain-containing protein n=1 Tax=Streptomyces sp. V4I8 TaxID=3156469 RepID=UPI00351372F1